MRQENIRDQLQRQLADIRQKKEQQNNVPIDKIAIELSAVKSPPAPDKSTKEKGSYEDLNPFPVEVFPIKLQTVSIATNEVLNYPIDFIAASILAATSSAIGNTRKLSFQKGWVESALLYLALVGNPGTGKSHPPSFSFRPIEKRDYDFYLLFIKLIRELENMEPDEKKEYLKSNGKPVWHRIIVKDFTIEALTTVLKNNPRGIAVYVDELAGFFKGFNRYSKGKGNEQEFWLSNWSNKAITVDRKGDLPIQILYSYIPLIGTIQPAILRQLGKRDLSDNGFIDRLLFVIPSNLKKEYVSHKELSQDIIDSWAKIITAILDIPMRIDDMGKLKPKALTLSADSYKIFTKWQNANADLINQCNSEGKEAIANIYSKLEIYTLRFALILQVLAWACDGEQDDEVSANSMQGAIRLVEYFRINALKANAIITNSAEGLSQIKKNVFEALPDMFSTADGLLVAKRFAMPEKTFKNFVNTSIFNKIKHGVYEKKY